MTAPILTPARVLILLPVLALAGCGGGGGSGEEDPATDEPAAITSPPSAEASPATPPAATGPRVVFLGDSLTAGFGLPGDEAFPAVLDRAMDAADRPIEVVNAGVSGDTTAGGLRRLDWLMRQEPGVVVIGLGANDGLRGLSVEEAADNLRAIVRGVRAGGAVPLLLGMRIPTNYGPDYAEAFAAIYPAVATELDVPFVPLVLEGVGGIDEMNLADGIHPNRAGHRRMAETIRPVLELALDRVDGGPPPEG